MMYIYICIGVLFCNQVFILINSIQSQNLSLLLSLFSLSLFLCSAIVKEQSTLNTLSELTLIGPENIVATSI